jgi:hypothetical protein
MATALGGAPPIRLEPAPGDSPLPPSEKTAPFLKMTVSESVTQGNKKGYGRIYHSFTVENNRLSTVKLWTDRLSSTNQEVYSIAYHSLKFHFFAAFMPLAALPLRPAQGSTADNKRAHGR